MSISYLPGFVNLAILVDYSRDYVATLAIVVKNGFGAYLPWENPPRFLFLKPNPPVRGMIAKISLKK
jgi:hypothetical protein